MISFPKVHPFSVSQPPTSLGGRRLRLTLQVALLLASALTALVTSPSFAQELTTERAATAESLFRTGRELWLSKNYRKACKAFRASQKLDPAVGTLLNLGKCYEALGRTASAWSAFSEAAGLARRLDQSHRAKIAKAEADRLRPLVPMIRLEIENLTPTTKLVLDSQELDPGALGLPFAVDPGEHTIRVTFEDGSANEISFNAKPPRPGNPAALLVQVKAPIDKPPPARSDESVDPTPPITPPTNAQVETADKPDHTSARWAGWIATGVGAAGVVTGVVLSAEASLRAQSTKRKSCDESSGSLRCTEAAVEERKQTDKQLLVGQIIAYSSAAALVGGVITLLLSRPDEPTGATASVSHNSIKLGWKGHF